MTKNISRFLNITKVWLHSVKSMQHSAWQMVFSACICPGVYNTVHQSHVVMAGSIVDRLRRCRTPIRSKPHKALTNADDVWNNLTPMTGLDANVVAFQINGGVNGETARQRKQLHQLLRLQCLLLQAQLAEPDLIPLYYRPVPVPLQKCHPL